MNNQELIKALNEIRNRQIRREDAERPHRCYDDDHEEADQLLLKFINDHKVSEAFESIEKWYN
ncbi:MAG: hypothetical protein AABY22_31465 [Nanoarchaeota archaeon]